MDNKIKRKKRKRRIRTSTLFFLFLTLASNSFAWFIYSTKVSNSITAKVRSWHVNFNVGGGETTEEYIEVNIQGSAKIQLLTDIERALENSLDKFTYQEKTYSKKIACVCSECKDKKDSNFFEIETIKKLVEKKVKGIQCYKSGKNLNIQLLQLGEFEEHIQTSNLININQTSSGGDNFVSTDQSNIKKG